MSTEPPPGSGPPPDDDPFRKHPPPPSGDGPQGGSPYDTPPGGRVPPPGGGMPPPEGGPSPPPPGGGPYGGGNYGMPDPLAGMPPLADSGRRVLARIIDMILVGIVVALLSWAFQTSEWQVDPDKVEYSRGFGQSLLAAVLYVAYDTVLTSRTGQTLGKRWLRMRVANLDNGATPFVQTSLARAAVLWLPFAFCCACLWTAIAGGWSFFDRPYKQGLHDKAAKTVVVSSA